MDEAHLIIDSNPPAARLLGYDPDELIGMPVSAVLPLAPDFGARHAPPPEAARHMTGRDKANRQLPLLVRFASWTDTAGRSRAMVIMRDDTADREIDLIRQNDLIQSDNAIRGANIGVFEFDLAKQSVSVSDIWRRMLEVDPDEGVDLQIEWRNRVHPDDLGAALEPIRLCGEGHAERASCEYRLQSRDRSRWRWMRTDIAIAHRDKSGQATVLVGAQTDITDRKEMEELLRISGEQFRAAFEYGPIGNAIVGLDGHFLKVNPALCTLLGYSEAELLSTDFQHLTHPDDLNADLHQLERLAKGEITCYSLEKRYFRENGEIILGSLSVRMVLNSEGKPDH
ncbi:MAG: PAS domain S-box protein, partial [Rhodoferax sp.]|nr:PAS domain S-box protein [Pseudorhodobacter sp.]